METSSQTLRSRFFSIDLRSLALFRIGLGLVVLADVIIRSVDLTAHYTDAGILPRLAIFSGTEVSWRQFLSLHLLNGSVEWQAFLFTLNGAAALALMVGWRTRAANVATWFLYLSMYSRNEMVIQGSDRLTTLLLLWALFLPTGARWSIDALRRPENQEVPRRVLSWASAAVILQICSIFWFTIPLKSGAEWTTDYNAVYFSVYCSWASVMAPLFHSLSYETLRTLTIITLIAEGGTPFLFFVPYRSGWFRLTGCLLLAGMFLAFLGVFNIGMWVPVAFVATTLFLPDIFWDTVLPRLWGGGVRRAEALASRIERFAVTRVGREPRRALPLRLSRPASAVVIITFIYITIWNIFTIMPAHTPSESLTRPGWVLRLNQRWGLFAPKPPLHEGWYRVIGRRADGETVPLGLEDIGLAGTERPSQMAEGYASHRWQIYMWRYTLYDDYRHLYGRYTCRNYNQSITTPGERLVDLEVRLRYRRTLLEHKRGPFEEDVLLHHRCEANDG